MVSAYVYLQPVMVTVLAWLVLGQQLDGRTVVAGLFILVGVGVVATSPPPAPKVVESVS